MAKRIDGYVDTSALIAFADRSDTHHVTFRRLFADPPSLMTTTLDGKIKARLAGQAGDIREPDWGPFQKQ